MTRDVLVGVVALVVTVFLGARACRNAPPSPKGNRRVGLRVLLLRGIGAGAAIACGVAMGRAGWMTAAGMASVFPAIFLTSMLATWMAQGKAVPIGASGPMMLGSVAVSICLGMCLQHAVDRPFGRINFGVDCGLGLRLTSGLPLAEKTHTGHLINMNCHWLSFR